MLEVCCASADFAVAAAAAGADRVELCDNLVEGGTTPSAGAIALAVERTGVPVMVMIRPRGGDFLYSDLEVEVMLHDIEETKRLGADGVVFGVLSSDGRVDVDTTTRLTEAAQPLSVTFHRAFDLSRDLLESLESLCAIGVDRVLTSAGRPAVTDDLRLLRALVEQAGDVLTILPGGGVSPENVEDVVAVPGICEVHVGAGRRVASGMDFRREGVPMGSDYRPDEYLREEADVEAIGRVAFALATRSEADGSRSESRP